MSNTSNVGPDPLRAKMFAEIGHAGQTYNDEVPYPYHLQMVVDVLTRYGFTSPMIISAAWCHDLIEDTSKSYNDIKSRFGTDVAELVYSVTSELGRNRSERNKKTYPKIRGNFFATVLKLADRIANVEYGAATGGKGDMYAKEYPEFKKSLKEDVDFNTDGDVSISKLVLERMWSHLDKLLGS